LNRWPHWQYQHRSSDRSWYQTFRKFVCNILWCRVRSPNGPPPWGSGTPDGAGASTDRSGSGPYIMPTIGAENPIRYRHLPITAETVPRWTEKSMTSGHECRGNRGICRTSLV